MCIVTVAVLFELQSNESSAGASSNGIVCPSVRLSVCPSVIPSRLQRAILKVWAMIQ